MGAQSARKLSVIMNEIHNKARLADRKDGFTLVELLIVIAVIGLLAAISIFGLQGARESARDSRRKSDLESIRSALEIHRADCGIYPATLGTQIVGSCNSNVYMQEVPKDPQENVAYSYNRLTNTSYALCSILEVLPSPANNTTNCDHSACTGSCDYKVVNP